MTGATALRPLPATEPPEARGLARDDVRLLVARPDGVEHARFRNLPHHLDAGDLVVVNTSATLPAAVDGLRGDGRAAVVHVATGLASGDRWVVELRRSDRSGPFLDGQPDEVVRLPGGQRLRLVAPRIDSGNTGGVRLWEAQVLAPVNAANYLLAHGRPITYGYVRDRWPLSHYQPIFGRHFGSAEMPSAGRPFTPQLVIDLITSGITVAPVTLHTGVSSPEADEGPQPELFEVPAATAALVNHTRERGGRVVAVGTTVTRALESAAHPDGAVTARHGWTDLVLGPNHPARVVDGLVTGWHEAGSSHLDLLRAVAGGPLVEAAYAAADGYRWHEFGDSSLFLPGRVH